MPTLETSAPTRRGNSTGVEEAAEEPGPDGAVHLDDGGGVAGAAEVGGDEEARQLLLVALPAEEAEAVVERRGGILQGLNADAR
jgi:hypothetical protein